jgi:tetratricopeptide (TPR) repeat protein
LNIYIKVYGTEHRDVGSAYNNIAASLKILRRLDEALVANDKALIIVTKILGVNHPNTITSRCWKGNILQTQGKLEEALVIRSEVLESRKRVLGEDPIDTVAARNYKANGLADLKRHDEALLLYDQVLASRQRFLDKNHPLVAESLGVPKTVLARIDAQFFPSNNVANVCVNFHVT